MRLRIDPLRPEKDKIEVAVKAIREGPIEAKDIFKVLG
jgi:hypothetical protein